MRQLFFLISLFLICFNFAFSQRGKDGNQTISSLNTVVNTYAVMTVGANVGETSITVANNALSGAGFSGNLSTGDLVMIIQMQGDFNNPDYEIDINFYPSLAWDVSATLASDYGNHETKPHVYGKVGKYGNAGNFEVREVLSVNGSNIINLTCPLENSYHAPQGHVQVIRIPRYNNLTLQNGASVVASDWDGNVGGVVSIEVNGNLVINGQINVSGTGFRAGLVNSTPSYTEGATQHTKGPGNGDSFLGNNRAEIGGAIGESIFGYTTEYGSWYITYGRGAIANGGGGGGPQNAGGGGGANIGDTSGHTGKGIPTPGYNIYWNAEKPNMATTYSSGGGRGGYTYATSPQNPNIGPNRSAWSGNARKENGGLGGHALVYHPSKLFLGGGGGAGGQDSGQGGSGGNGGGIVHLTVYGNISGSGTIEANGANGQNSNPTGQSTPFNGRRGNDGAGGGGGGGYIYIKNSNPIPSTVGLNARGGNGGTHALTRGNLGGNAELCGPGAGGAGGGIAYTSGTPTTSIIGGIPGGTTDNGGQNAMSTQFPMNGATSGGLGLTNLPAPTYDIIVANDTICGSQSTTLTVSVTGTLPGGTTVGWYTAPFGGTEEATGTTFNTPTLSSTTTYYVGVCPGGTFRKPVTVVVGANPLISGTADITDATCTTGGSISGLTASGGTGTLTYDWNGTTSTGTDLSDASAGSYTLTVTDENGCTAQSGPHVITGVGGPSISGTPVIEPETCNAGGSISGLTVTGGSGTLTYTWNGNSYPGPSLPDTSAGSYTLIVTDGNNCTAQSGPHVIGTAPIPSITGTPVITNENCNDGGSVTGLSVTGGVGPYTYSWSNSSATTIDLLDVPEGTYTLTVTDDNGCDVQSGPHAIGRDSEPVIGGVASITDATCLVNGSITGLTVSGGISPFTYEWNSITTPTIDLQSAPPGDYILTITDANGCTATSSMFTVNAPDMPIISGTPTIEDVTCGSLGSIEGLSVSGGNTPYVYVWNTDITPTIDLTGASANDYTLTVTDNSGCAVQSGPYTIGTVAPPTFGGTVTIEDATCSQGGRITGITVSGGAQPYTYQWNGNSATNIDLINVSAGNYTLTVTDANDCVITSGPHTIGSIGTPSITGTATVINATCQTGGAISGLSVTGGTGPYTYSWNGGAYTTLNISDLIPDDYTLQATDANGCIVTSITYTVNPPSNPVIGGSLVIENANCLHGGDITGLSVTGGTAPYTYSWNGGAYTTLDIYNVPAGVYTLIVTDAGLCTVTSNPLTVSEDVFVDAQFTYSPNPVSVNDVVQFHDASVGNIVDWSWQIDTTTMTVQHPNYVFTQDGIYNVTLTVVDANGCVDSISVSIEVLSDIEVPNVITVNGDGINDLFILKGLLPNTKLLILNRWDNLIYTSDNYDNTWDGRDMSGKVVVEGVYTYSVVTPDGSQKHGFIHIVH